MLTPPASQIVVALRPEAHSILGEVNTCYLHSTGDLAAPQEGCEESHSTVMHVQAEENHIAEGGRRMSEWAPLGQSDGCPQPASDARGPGKRLT